MAKPKRILVLDIGGSHVKCLVSGRKRPVKFKSGPAMTPDIMMRKLRKLTRRWRYDAVSIGYPGVVRGNRIVREPQNLGSGWMAFDFQAALGCPVRMINDAAMQALGAYEGGRMLFLGLGTGLGSTLIFDGAIAPMELGHLPCSANRTYEDDLGNSGRKRLGGKAWRKRTRQVLGLFRKALRPDYIVLGGGNARRLKRQPPHTRRGSNADAFRGGFRLWEQRAAP